MSPSSTTNSTRQPSRSCKSATGPPPQVEQRTAGTGRHQQIHVTDPRVVPSCHRAEDSHFPGAVPLGQTEDFLPALSQHSQSHHVRQQAKWFRFLRQLSNYLPGSAGQSANSFEEFSPQSEHPQFTLYRCTEFVTYTGSSVFAIGYAFSALLAPPRVANSRVLKPLRTAYRGPPPRVRARYPEPPTA